MLDDSFEDVDDDIEGQRAYSIEEKLSPRSFNNTRDINKLRGRGIHFGILELVYSFFTYSTCRIVSSVTFLNICISFV